jgi:hypothetical protein
MDAKSAENDRCHVPVRTILPLPFWCWFEVFPMQLAVEFVVIVRIIQLCLYRIEKKYVGNLQGKEQSITLA